jgi:hypothetical protein
MTRALRFAAAFAFPIALGAQSAAASYSGPTPITLQFVRFADIFGGRLVAAFKAIPAAQYDYRPTPAQQTIGYIAQHLEDANYGLCSQLGSAARPRTSKDSLADTVKARWPKDTLIARLDASLRFCDAALQRVVQFDSPAVVSTLLAFETDLAEHYSQLAVYMRLIGLVPPSAVPPRQRTAIDVPAAELAPYVGRYRVVPGLLLLVTMQDGALSIQSVPGGSVVRLWAESNAAFFVKGVDAQVTFVREAPGAVTGLVFHQFGRDRAATRVP